MTSVLFKLLWEVGAHTLLGVLLVVKVPTRALGSSIQLVLAYGLLNSGWKVSSKADRARLDQSPLSRWWWFCPLWTCPESCLRHGWQKQKEKAPQLGTPQTHLLRRVCLGLSSASVRKWNLMPGWHTVRWFSFVSSVVQETPVGSLSAGDKWPKQILTLFFSFAIMFSSVSDG